MEKICRQEHGTKGDRKEFFVTNVFCVEKVQGFFLKESKNLSNVLQKVSKEIKKICVYSVGKLKSVQGDVSKPFAPITRSASFIVLP